MPFRTFCEPQLVTLPASPIGADNAGLNVSLRPNGAPTTFRYVFSTSPDLANPVTTAERGPVEGTGRTRGKINPSSIPGRKKPARKVTFATFEYQLAVGKAGVAISQIQPEKLDPLKRIKCSSTDTLVTVSDANNNRQTIRRPGSLVLAK